MDKQLAIYCADVGSVSNKKFGWAHVEGECQRVGDDMAALAVDIAVALRGTRKVALGFECPLWVPVAADPQDLTRARKVDGNRAWSAAAGTAALATGLTQVSWILDEVRRQLTAQGARLPRVYLDWTAFSKADSGLLLWEAFVTGEAKASSVPGTNGHSADAMVACREFAAQLPNPAAGSVPEPTRRIRSLIGGAILWAGWSMDTALLRTPCMVVRPSVAGEAGQVMSPE